MGSIRRSLGPPSGALPTKHRSNAPEAKALRLLQAKIRAGFRDFDPDSRALFSALLLGESLPVPLRDRFRKAGLSHLVAQSGLHIGLAYGVSRALLGPLGSLRNPLALLPAGLYALLAGARPASLRALCMLALAIATPALGLRTSPLGSLCLFLAGICLISPATLASPGLHLSIAATFGILELAPRGKDHLEGLVPPWIASPLALGLASQVATLPGLLALGAPFPLLGLGLNLIAVPVTAILLPVGAGLGTLGVLSPALSGQLGVLARPGVEVLLFLASFGTESTVLPTQGWGPPLAPWLGILWVHFALRLSSPRGSSRTGSPNEKRRPFEKGRLEEKLGEPRRDSQGPSRPLTAPEGRRQRGTSSRSAQAASVSPS